MEIKMENTITVTLTKEQQAAILKLSTAALLNAIRMDDPRNQFGDFNQEENDARIMTYASIKRLLTWETK